MSIRIFLKTLYQPYTFEQYKYYATNCPLQIMNKLHEPQMLWAVVIFILFFFNSDWMSSCFI